MSFDPITGIWAANKAAEIVGGSGSGGSDLRVTLPLVELSSEITVSMINSYFLLPAEDSAKLSVAFSTGLPVIISLTLADINEKISVMFMVFANQLIANLGLLSLTIGLDTDSGLWFYTATPQTIV